MTVSHIEFLVEEPSMEAFLRAALPKIIETTSFEVYVHQGKDDLISRLEERLRGYSNWLPADWRVIVLLDRDDDNCTELKGLLEIKAATSLLLTSSVEAINWQVAFRIAIEELESWFFGDWQAVCQAYPKLNLNVSKKAAYRNSDAILGGTWEALERELQRAGYFVGGLRKIEAAREIGTQFDPDNCASPSFKSFQTIVKGLQS